MHSGIAYFIYIALDKNAHSSIAYNTIIVIINVFYKLEDMVQTFMIFLLCIFFVVVVTIRADCKFFTQPS